MRDMNCVRKLFIKALEGMVAQTGQECYRGALAARSWSIRELNQDFDYIMVHFPCFLDERTDPQQRRDALKAIRLDCGSSGLLSPVYSYRNRGIKRQSWVGD